MAACHLLVLSALVVCLDAVFLKFPPEFKFGAGTASYQIEGAWNISDKSTSVWDDFTHEHQTKIADGSNGDVACDSYNQWRRDIAIAEELGLDFYRFSISWPRLLPGGFTNKISENGTHYYNQLIDGLLEKGIEPVVTLFHWDMPQRLQNLGGWANPLISNWFASYARVVFTLYGDRVKTWITINEPLIVCEGGYSGFMAPGLQDLEVGAYLCNKHILMAHAKAWRVYDEEFRAKYKGQISLCNLVDWYEADRRSDTYVAQLAMENFAGRYSHPIFSKEGGWPPTLEKLVAENSKKQGYTKSRLPAFNKEEIELIRGTYDYYGLNHYTSRSVRKPRPGEKIEAVPFIGSQELGYVLDWRAGWKQTCNKWMRANPKGIRNTILWLREQYGDINIWVTENGFPTAGNDLNDEDRVQFFKDYMAQVLFAIKKDGVNVTRYSVWSLIDTFEWSSGYSNKFGLYEVNFTDPNRPRTPRTSALFYKNVIKTRSLDKINESNSYIVWLTIAIVLTALIITAFVVKYCRAVKKSKSRMRYENVALNSDLDCNVKIIE